MTRARVGGGGLRTPRQARATVTKELSGEKHQAARGVTEHRDPRGNKTTTHTSNKHSPQARGGEGAYADKELILRKIGFSVIVAKKTN